jgi:hypothetical protein
LNGSRPIHPIQLLHQRSASGACRVNCERPIAGEPQLVLELAIDAGSLPDAIVPEAMGRRYIVRKTPSPFPKTPSSRRTPGSISRLARCPRRERCTGDISVYHRMCCVMDPGLRREDGRSVVTSETEAPRRTLPSTWALPSTGAPCGWPCRDKSPQWLRRSARAGGDSPGSPCRARRERRGLICSR